MLRYRQMMTDRMGIKRKVEEKKMSMSKNIARLAVTAGLTAALSFGGVMAPVTMAFAEMVPTVATEKARCLSLTLNIPTHLSRASRFSRRRSHRIRMEIPGQVIRRFPISIGQRLKFKKL